MELMDIQSVVWGIGLEAEAGALDDARRGFVAYPSDLGLGIGIVDPYREYDEDVWEAHVEQMQGLLVEQGLAVIEPDGDGEVLDNVLRPTDKFLAIFKERLGTTLKEGANTPQTA